MPGSKETSGTRRCGLIANVIGEKDSCIITLLSRDECLAYIENAVLNPPVVPHWHKWVNENLASIEAAFERREFLTLKFRGLIGAHSVLLSLGRIEPSDVAYDPLDFKQTHCDHCGAPLFWVIPGVTTRAEIVAHAKSIGDEQTTLDPWIHPGVFCPSRCITRLYNIVPR